MKIERSRLGTLMVVWGLLLLIGAPPGRLLSSEQGAPSGKSQALTAEMILDKAGKVLFPVEFSAEIELIEHKPGAEDVVTRMRLYKKGTDQVRTDTFYPPEQEGQRMLRKDGQIWSYFPETRRAVKLSPKQSIGQSDFTNGDIMRLDFNEDYLPSIATETATEWVLELKAKSSSVTYDRVRYTISKDGFKSIRQEFYTLSGKRIKSLEFRDYKTYGGLLRPSLFVMTSDLNKGVYTELKYLKFENGKSLPDAEFRPEAMTTR